MRRFRAMFAASLLVMTVGVASAAAPVGVAESYIVVLKPGVSEVGVIAAQLARAHGGEVGFIYQHALQGFSIRTSPAAAVALARNPQVAYVEADAEVSIAAQEVPTGIKRIFADGNANLDINATDDYRVDVDVAVIDTGVDFQHPDLNVVGGVNCAGGGPFSGSCASGGDDDHYHGTHVAGTIGALDNGIGVVGVAPGARIWAVKVLNQRGSGYTSWIVAGIDWVAANSATIEVANMSLGGSGYSQAEYDAIQGAVNTGVAFAVAAGNSDANADNYSPAAFDNVLTVSAIADFDGLEGGLGSPTCRNDQDDTLADFSNWGSAVNLAAPGVCITSTFPIEKGEYGTISGTSMASPHAAGALAMLASGNINNPGNAADVNALYSQVKSNGNDGWTDDSGDGTKEPLLDVSDFGATLVAGSGGDGGSDTIPPVSPSGLTSTAGDGHVTLTWNANTETDLSSYSVYVNGTFEVSGLTGTGYTVTGLTNGTAYTLGVTATDTAGNESDPSTVTAVPQSPSSSDRLLASATNQGKTWTATVTTPDDTSLTGDFDYGGGTCSGSTCTLAGIPKKVSSVTFSSDGWATVVIAKP